MLGVPRFCDQFFGDETIFARGENDPTYSDLQRSNSGEKSLSENSVTDYRETDLLCTGSFPSAPLLQAFVTAPSKGYETVVHLSDDCWKDLQQWINQMSTWNGRSIITPAPDLTLTTDASLRGWGAMC